MPTFGDMFAVLIALGIAGGLVAGDAGITAAFIVWAFLIGFWVAGRVYSTVRR